MRTRQIKVLHPALSAVINTPPVKPGHAARILPVRLAPEHRHDHAPVQMLVAAFPVDAQPRQPRADFRPGRPVLVRQPQAQRTVREPDAEPLQGFHVVKSAFREVFAGGCPGRRTHQPFLVVIHDLPHQLRVPGRKLNRRLQARHRRHARQPLRRWRGKARPGRQQLECVPEAHPVELFHELNDIARRPAPHAMPEPFSGTHHERSRVFLVERAPPDQVPATVPLEFHPPASHQCPQVDGGLDPVDFVFWNAWHNFKIS